MNTRSFESNIGVFLLQNLSLADAFVLWIGAQELIAGLLYLWTGEPWKALAWGSYGLACVGLAMAGK